MRGDDSGSLSGLPVLVAGAGVTGNSVATALLACGASVTVTDSDADRLHRLDHLDVSLVPALAEPPRGTAVVVTSPGWRPDAPLLRAASERGIEVIGDVELAWRLGERDSRPADWLAVTGTNGKTTTVGMLASILAASGADTTACGNIGLAVPDAVRERHRVLAVELSSFQLHWSRSVCPHAAAVLNVSEDHLDWHGGMDAYVEAKGRIYRGARWAVYNADDPISTRLARAHADPIGFTRGEPGPGELGVVDGMLTDRAFGDATVPGGTELAAVSEVSPPGPHNVANALAAAALARSYGVPAAAVRAGLRDYRTGGHRAAHAGEVDGVSYVDDSKATNPHAAAASLLAHRRVVWIAGGLLKGASVDELVAEVAGRLAGAVLLGADRDVIAAALARHAPDVPVLGVGSGEDEPMTVAVAQARTLAAPGDVVLLAPAAASLDMFDDYAARGDAFAAAVARLHPCEPRPPGEPR